MKSRLTSIALGVVAGLTVLVLRAMTGETLASQPKPSAVQTDVDFAHEPGAGHSQELSRRIAELERRVAEGRQYDQANASDLHQTQDKEDPVARQAREQEEQRVYKQAWRDKLAAFERESIDERWAEAAATAFRSEFGEAQLDPSLGFAPGEIVDLQCRSSSCRVRVKWPTPADAAGGYSAYLTHQYTVNCNRHYRLDSEFTDAVEGPVTGTLLFDCGETQGRQGE